MGLASSLPCSVRTLFCDPLLLDLHSEPTTLKDGLSLNEPAETSATEDQGLPRTNTALASHLDLIQQAMGDQRHGQVCLEVVVGLVCFPELQDLSVHRGGLVIRTLGASFPQGSLTYLR